jgi:hypothetical protein
MEVLCSQRVSTNNNEFPLITLFSSFFFNITSSLTYLSLHLLTPLQPSIFWYALERDKIAIYSFSYFLVQTFKDLELGLSLIICAMVFAQPLLHSIKSAKKKKTRKKFFKYPLSETSKDICDSRRHWSCETKHRQNDDIAFARHFTRRSRNVCAMLARQKCKKSKNRQKTKKLVFFKFLTRVKSNTYKKWGVGSTYTPL